MIKNYDGKDGLVLCAIGGIIDIEKWIGAIDMWDHSVLNYEDILQSVNNLLKVELITQKKNKFIPSPTAKSIVKGSWRMSTAEWQTAVRERICHYTFDDGKETNFYFSKEEYESAYKRYWERMARWMRS